MPDATTDEAHARKLARSIESYWRARGYPGVRCTVERVTVNTGEGTFAVKSNLQSNGLPENFRGFQ